MNNEIKTMVRGAYDIQKLRTQMGNRIVGNFKAKLGQAPGKKEETLEEAQQRVMKELRAHYAKLMDGVKVFPRVKAFVGDAIISSYTELSLVAQYISLEDEETRHFARLGNVLKENSLFVNFLEKVKGCGPAMSGVIISEIDISKAKYASSLWKLAGYDVAEDGQGRSRRKEHLVERAYENKEGEMATRMGLTFNPFLKTKLHVLAASFIKQKDSPYRKSYDDYKHRLENHPVHKEKTKLHRHRVALRYMIKRFLVDLYRAWRTLEGLPVYDEYSEAKLGLKHAA